MAGQEGQEGQDMILSFLNSLKKKINKKKLIKSYHNKVTKILSSMSNANEQSIGEISIVADHISGYSSLDWHKAYCLANNLDSANYLPEDFYYAEVEPSLNNFEYAKPYMDKSYFGFLLQEGDYIGNEFFHVNGQYYSADGSVATYEKLEAWALQQNEIVFKPAVETGGGRGIHIGKSLDILPIIKGTNSRFIIQSVLIQHQGMAVFHPDSLNTVRIMTLRKGGEIIPLSAVYRVGVGESRVDNQAAGGISCGIDENGTLREFAYDKNLGKCTVHPTTNKTFLGAKIPNWNGVIDVALRNHKRLTEFDIISWDIAIDESGIAKIIEFNLLSQEINFLQINNGPLFSEHTEWLLAKINNVN